jgi:hypothetical protein
LLWADGGYAAKLRLFIDTNEAPEVALDSSGFKPVWDVIVIKALRAHDEVLGEQLDTLRRAMGQKGGRPPTRSSRTFATVRLRQRVTKGPGSRAAGVAMAFKLIESAQRRWRLVNAPHLVALVRAGAEFKDGKLVERPDESGPRHRQRHTRHGPASCAPSPKPHHPKGLTLVLWRDGQWCRWQSPQP